MAPLKAASRSGVQVRVIEIYKIAREIKGTIARNGIEWKLASVHDSYATLVSQVSCTRFLSLTLDDSTDCVGIVLRRHLP